MTLMGKMMKAMKDFHEVQQQLLDCHVHFSEAVQLAKEVGTEEAAELVMRGLELVIQQARSYSAGIEGLTDQLKKELQAIKGDGKGEGRNAGR